MIEKEVVCPACKGPAIYAERNRWRPFCSERCRRLDLGAWANEEYRVASATPPDPDADDDVGRAAN